MSDARATNIAKLSANVTELEVQQSQEEQGIDDSRLDTEQQTTQVQKKELNTQRQITRLEKALEVAKSDAVKSKLKEEIELAKLRKDEEEQRKKEELETIQTAKQTASVAGNVAGGLAGAASNVADKTVELAQSTASTLATVATPGSIFLPIALLLLFFFLILPVNGMTRAQWLWLAITGQATIKRGASGDFGNQPTTGGSGDIETSTLPVVPPTTGYKIGNNYYNQYIRRQR